MIMRRFVGANCMRRGGVAIILLLLITPLLHAEIIISRQLPNSLYDNPPDSGTGYYKYEPTVPGRTCIPNGYPDSTMYWGDQLNTITKIRSMGSFWDAQRMIEGFCSDGYCALIGIGDISFKDQNGEALTCSHAGHRYGRSIDLRPQRKDGEPLLSVASNRSLYRVLVNQRNPESGDYSRRNTQALIDEIYVHFSTSVKCLFFNDPGIRGATVQPAHWDHIHVGLVTGPPC